jgi:hypothetical protein
VVKVLKPGTYKLANEDGEELTNAWNIQQLRRFYLLTQKVHPTPITQQAEKLASHAPRENDVPVNFS